MSSRPPERSLTSSPGRGRAQGLAAASVSANTRRAYEGALRRLRDWLAGRPLNDDTLAGYLAARFEAGRSPAVVAASGGGSVRGLRDAALLAVMSDGLLLRVSEAAEIEVADLEAEGANTLTIRRSKTDQEGEGAVQYIGGPTVDRVRAWLSAAAIADGAMFQRLDRAGRPRGRLSTVSVRAIVQRRAAEAGIEGRVSGHSLRVGGAQSLAAAGASIVEMQTAGRWQSPSHARPLRQRPARRPRRGCQAPLRGVGVRGSWRRPRVVLYGRSGGAFGQNTMTAKTSQDNATSVNRKMNRITPAVAASAAPASRAPLTDKPPRPPGGSPRMKRSIRVESLCDSSASKSSPDSTRVYTSEMSNSPDRGSQTSLRNVALVAP